MRLPTISQVPAFRVLLPLIAGILLFVAQPVDLWGIVLVVISVLMWLGSRYIRPLLSPSYKRYYNNLLTAVASAAVGFWLTARIDSRVGVEFPAGKRLYTAEVMSVPEVKEHSVHCLLKVQQADSSGGSSCKIVGYFEKNRESIALKQGWKVVIGATPRKPVNTARPGGFDYGSYLHRQGISGTAYIDSASWRLVSADRDFSLFYLAADMREEILNIFRSFRFQENEFALLSGITIGYTDSLTPEQKSNFSSVGLSHLMAVSGMQTAMLFAMVWFLLGFIPKNSKWYRAKYVIVILFLWIFAFVTGLSASVNRAALMLTALMLAGLSDKRIHTLNAMFLSAICLLLINPFTLFDIGFQLSYLAVLGLFFSQDLLGDRILQLKKRWRYVTELSTMTLAAQLATSPLSIFYFNQFPVLFLIANLAVLPFNGLLVYWATGCAALQSVGVFHPVMAVPLHWMLMATELATQWFARFPYALIRELHPTLIQILIIYALLLFVVLFAYKRRIAFLFCAIGTIIVLEISEIERRITVRDRAEIWIYNTYGTTTIELLSNGKSVIAAPKERYHLLKGKRIVCLAEDIRYRETDFALSCDYLILQKGFKGNLAELKKQYRFGRLVLDAGLSPYYANQIESETKEATVGCYNIAQKGALRIDLNSPATPAKADRR